MKANSGSRPSCVSIFHSVASIGMMKQMRLLLVVALVCLHVFASRSAEACSAVLLRCGDQLIAGRNYDWHMGQGMVMVNQRQIAKQALSFDNPAKWVSKYGSVTFNQYGRELPCDGMNEKGLVVTMLWLNETEYPESDSRPSVTVAQWTQYQLDTAATVEEVIASDKQIRITPFGGVKIHYFVADATGDSATIEFLKGKMVVHRGSDMAVPAITNSTYESSAQFLSKHAGFGGDLPTPQSLSSLDRFTRLCANSCQFEPGSDALALESLAVMDTVAKDSSTQWQIAYDITARKLHFRTKSHRAIRDIAFDRFNFDNTQPVLVLDMDEKLEGDVTSRFEPYTAEHNKRLIDKAMADAKRVVALPSAIRDMVVNYPDFYCKPVGPPSAKLDAGQ
jgi:penicillin V acylase-like amidase (Ntn superfamily)